MVNDANDKRPVRADLVAMTRSLLVGPLAVEKCSVHGEMMVHSPARAASQRSHAWRGAPK